jgi:hypothetical protein
MRGNRLISLLVCLLVASGTASAALDTSNVYTDANGVTWTDTVTITSSTDSNLSAEVEYVVNKPVSHNGQNEFEYVYQMKNVGTYSISRLGVAMLASNEANDIGSYQIDTGDVAPNSAYFVGTPPDRDQAVWTFDDLVADANSYALNYWSVNQPRMWLASIQDGGVLGMTLDLPSPSNVIPEPATCALLAAAGGALLRRRRRR